MPIKGLSKLLSPSDRALAHIQWVTAQARSRFNFHTLQIYQDWLLLIGHSQGELDYAYGRNSLELSKPLTKPWLDTLISNHKIATLARLTGAGTRPGAILPKTKEEEDREYDELMGKEERIRASDSMIESSPSLEIVPASYVLDFKQINTTPSYTPDSSHPLQRARLWDKQSLAASQLYEGILRGKTGQLLNAATGAGKTYVLGAVIRRLIDNRWKPLEECLSPWPIVYITKASIVEQTSRDLRDEFGIDTVNKVTVLNIEQLRANFGDMFIKWETIISQGVESVCPIWKPNIHPLLFLWDECHILKNINSQQSLTAQDVNNIPDRYSGAKVFQVFSSATAATRVIEFKCFAVSTHCEVNDIHSYKGKTLLTNKNWSAVAANIAHPALPEEYVPAAVERLVAVLLDYIVDIKGLRPQFHPRNKVEIIDFETLEQRKQYEVAWDEYLKKKAEFEASGALTGSESRMMILAQFTIFRKEAEFIRIPTIVRKMYRDTKEGSAAVCATSFKGSIARAVKALIEEYHITRKQISIIWGGMDTKAKVKRAKRQEPPQLVLDQETKDKMIHNLVLSGASMEEIQELIDQLDQSAIPEPRVATDSNRHKFSKEDIELYDLGPQSKEKRQEEIDRFQNGKSLFCFFTLKAGGVGLSLHHTDRYTKQKCRRHANKDWVLEEDIPLIPTRPRVVYIPPVYSAMELVQGLGRCPRLTSLSDTPQTLIFYKGTIEEAVARAVSIKLKCLKKVVRQKESWEDIIINPNKLVESIKEIPKDFEQSKQLNPPEDSEDDVFLGEEGED